MPVYDYKCLRCAKTFSISERITEHGEILSRVVDLRWGPVRPLPPRAGEEGGTERRSYPG